MASKVGKIFLGLAGAGAGFIAGGPIGAVYGGLSGFSAGHGIDSSQAAKQRSKDISYKESEAIRGQQIKADEIARKQEIAKEKAMQKVSAGKAKASQRRVKGGLFGDAQSGQNYTLASKLGG